ncbi:MAG: hypothetical protein HN341_08895 [Verrucomicrobia bacterium]|nr:hypothetical protein [Verrucomicrobiota bacterium]
MRLATRQSVRTLVTAALTTVLATTALAHRLLSTTIKGSLFLDEDGLRHEIQVAHFLLPPAKALETVPDLASNDALLQEIRDYIAEQHPVKIDGIRVLPTIQDLTFAPVRNGAYLNTSTNYIRVAFTVSYATMMPPKQISFVWQLFPGAPDEGWAGLVDQDQDPYEIIQTFATYGEGNFVFFSPSEPEFIWHAEPSGRHPTASAVHSDPQWRIPILSLMLAILAGLYLTSPPHRSRPLRVRLPLAGALLVMACLSLHLLSVPVPSPFSRIQMPTDDEALTLFAALHANIYRAFDYGSEEEIYDVLSQSVDGALLDDLYAQIYKSLILRYSGGAVCKVAKVDILEARLIQKTREAVSGEHTVEIGCKWQVQGIVEHWEHLHRRVNEYEARFTLSPRARTWKICRVDITSQERVEAEDKPRGRDEG